MADMHVKMTGCLMPTKIAMKASTKPPAKSNKPQSFKDKGSVAGRTYSASARTPATVVLRNLRELEVSANQGAEKLEPEELEELVELLMTEVMSKVETGMLYEEPVKDESHKSTVGKGDSERRRTTAVNKAGSQHIRSLQPPNSQKKTSTTAVRRSPAKATAQSTASITRHSKPSKKKPPEEEVISKPQPTGESKEQQNETVKSLKASSKRNSSKELIKLESRKSIMFDSGKVETQVAPEEIPLSNVIDKVKTLRRASSNMASIATSEKNDNSSFTKTMNKVRVTNTSEASQGKQSNAAMKPIEPKLKLPTTKPNPIAFEKSKRPVPPKKIA